MRALLKAGLDVALVALAAALLSATLAWMSPGFGSDERELDARLSQASRAALRAERQRNGDIVRFYGEYLRGLGRGQIGNSTLWQRPVSELLCERAGVTARLLAFGMAGAWLAASAAAVICVLFRGAWLHLLLGAAAGLWLAVPAGALAILLLLVNGPAAAGVVLLVFPALFYYLRNILLHCCGAPHVLCAQARGLGPLRILFRHIVPVAWPQVLALAGVSISMGIGAAIPLEAICDVPGLGQLAWKAALARDLPVLVNLTLIISLVTHAVNRICDAAQQRRGEALCC